MLPNTLQISGQIIDRNTRRGLPGLQVEAWDRDAQNDDLLGNAISDAEGHFSIASNPSQFDDDGRDRLPELYFKVFDSQELVYDSRPQALRDWTPQPELLVIEVEARQPDGEDRSFVVEGEVVRPNGEPLKNYRVRAYDRALCDWRLLGGALTNEDGHYRIQYEPAQLEGWGKTRADLKVSVFAPQSGAESLASSPLYIQALPHERVDFSLGDGHYRGPDEYTRLERALAPLLSGLKDLNCVEISDVMILARQVNQPASNVAFYVKAQRWSGELDLPAPLFYGLFRRNLPGQPAALFARPLPALWSALRQAEKRNLIGVPLNEALKERLSEAQQQYLAQPDHPYQVLLRTTSLDDQQSALFTRQLLSGASAGDDFWEGLTATGNFSVEEVHDLQGLFEVVALTGDNPSLAVHLRSVKNVSQPRQVAAFSLTEWNEIVAADGVEIPDHILPGQTDEVRRQAYGQMLFRTSEMRYPTASLVAKMGRSELWQGQPLVESLARFPDFAFETARLAGLLSEHPEILDSFPDPQQGRLELLRLEQLFHLTPLENKTRVIEPLWQAGLRSAPQIAGAGRHTLLRQVAGQLTRTQVDRIYQNAIHITATSLIVHTLYHPRLNSPSSYALRARLLTPEQVGAPSFALASAATDLPEWAELFGSADACEIPHWASVLGPAAYLVDLLDYLRRAIDDNGKNGLDYLLERRPDLGTLQLTQANTETTLPYIDVVNEMMEQIILAGGDAAAIPDTGFGQTTWQSDLLAAQPERLEPGAYEILRQAVYPFKLPMDLWLEEGRRYLDHMKVSRHELMETLPRLPGVGDDDLAAEALGMSPVEREIICTVNRRPGKLAEYWGIDLAHGSLVVQLRQIKTLVRQAEMDFDTLLRLLNTRFLNPGRYLAVEFSGDPCSLENARLGRADGAELEQADSLEFLDRVHRFLRLQRRLGWSEYELDQAITALDIHDFNAAGFLGRLAAVEELRIAFRLPVADLCVFWSDLDTYAYEEDLLSQYEALFINPALFPDTHDGSTPDLRNEVFALTPDRTDLALTVSTDPNLSRWLAESDGAEIPQYTLNPDYSAYLQATTRLTTEDVALLAAEMLPKALEGHVALNLANLSLLYRIAAFTRALGVGVLDYLRLVKLMNQTPLATPDSAVNPLETSKFWQQFGEVDDRDWPIEELAYLLLDDVEAAIIYGPISEDVDLLLSALSAGFGGIADTPDDIESARTNSEARLALAQSLGATLGLDGEVLEDLLFDLRPDLGNALMDHLILAANPGLTNLMTPALDFHGLYELLHKFALSWKPLALDRTHLAFILVQGPGLGWIDLAGLPLEPQAAAHFQSWLKLVWAADLQTALFTVEQSCFGLLETAAQAALSRDEFLAQAGAWTGWNLSDLTYLAGPDGFDWVYPDHFQDERWLTQMHEAFTVLQPMGVSAVQAHAWVDTTLDYAQAQSIKQALKLAYGEQAWLSVMAGLQDGLRTLKRDGLLGYLLHRLGSQDSVDFYNHYLIDAEMDPCALTSRIVLAHNTVQLFAQRIILGLEPTLSMSREDAEGLQWRKNYRVWEAARKVFLYPENWMEPELRDDKTVFFRELEDSLLQDEVTQDAVVDKFREYLLKLDQVSRLEIMALYQDEELDVLHVFGRTKDIPHLYFYRRWENQARWSSWERVSIEIPSDHLIPITFNGRLYLFWPEFKVTQNEDYTIGTPASLSADEEQALRDEIEDLEQRIAEIETTLAVLYALPKPTSEIEALEQEKAEKEIELIDKEAELGAATEAIPAVARYDIELGMAWSDYRQGAWSAKSVSEEKMFYCTNATISRHYFTGWVSDDQNLKIAVRTNNTGNGSGSVPEYFGYFYFDDCQGQLLKSGEEAIDTPIGEVTVSGSLPSQQALVWGSPTWSVEYLELNLDGGTQARKLLTSGGRFIYAHQYGSGGSKTSPFIITDYERSYFVVPQPGFSLVSDTVFHSQDIGLRASPGIGARLRSTALKMDAVHFSNESALVVDHSLNQAANGLLNDSLNQVGGILAEERDLTLYTNDLTDGARYVFTRFYHPYPCLFLQQLSRRGVDGLLHPDPDDGSPESINLYRQMTPLETFDFETTYKPEFWVSSAYPKDEIDFAPDSPWGVYNWEIFFHIPLLIAIRLMENQRFAEAQHWFQYLFDPNNTDGEAPERFWMIKPFYEEQANGPTETMQGLIDLLEGGNYQLEQQVESWLADPFNPFAIARMRVAAYMRNTFMKYLDCLIAEADQLFYLDTMESVNQAMQLYLLAGELLGEKPALLPEQEPAIYTPNALLGRLDIPLPFETPSDPLEQLASLIPTGLPGAPDSPGKGSSGRVITIDIGLDNYATLWMFGIPHNEKLYGYWELVADRLFKIRHCMNIGGQARQLPLFSPPIDPALLVRASAAGLDISSVLNSLYSPRPNYRFAHLLNQAVDLSGEVRALGAALLAAIEKKDAEELGLLRTQHGIHLLESSRAIKEQQISEAKETIQAQQRALDLASMRRDHYASLLEAGLNTHESKQLDMMKTANLIQVLSQGAEQLAAVLYAFPQVILPVGSEFGGLQLGQAAQAGARTINLVALDSSYQANRSATEGGNKRRAEEWRFQKELAAKEIEQIEKQILTAEIRQQIVEKDLENLDKQTEQEVGVEEFLKLKFSNQALYNWMVSKLSGLYFQAYQIAYQQAKGAEKAFQQELGQDQSVATYIQPTYYDSLKKGLLAGEQLGLDLKRMQVAFLEQHKREYELTRHISLRQLDPLALLTLKATGACEVTIPEWLYDLDNPGHYLRRIKSVSLSIPAVTGPFTSVNCTLTLLNSSVRKSSLLQDSQYARQDSADERFLDYTDMIQSIVTSSGTNDSGLFETSLRDERYLPFEGSGAISTWRLELPASFRQFDYNTITDIIVHVRYTARPGGALLAEAAVANLEELLGAASVSGLAMLFSLKHDFPSEWHQFLTGSGDFVATLKRDYFPYFTQGSQISLAGLQVCAIQDGQLGTLTPGGINLAVYSNALNEEGIATLALAPDETVLVRDQQANVFLLLEYTVEPG